MDSIKINLKEVGWEDVDWVHLTQAGTGGIIL
jgi:hypothetical protein